MSIADPPYDGPSRQSIDYDTTRRKVEEALRKAKDPHKLVRTAQLWGVDVVYEETEVEQPKKWEYRVVNTIQAFSPNPAMQELLRALARDSAWETHFTTYRIGNTASMESISRHFLTKTAAEKAVEKIAAHHPDPDSVTVWREQDHHLLQMRQILHVLYSHLYDHENQDWGTSSPSLSSGEQQQLRRLWSICFHEKYPGDEDTS